MEKLNYPLLLSRYVEKFDLQSTCGFDLLSVAELYRFKKGELLLNVNHVPGHIYFLVKGKVKVFSYTSTSRPMTCGYHDGFALLGEAASLWGNLPSNNVQALTECDCVGVSLSRHRDVLLNDVPFLQYVGKTLAERLTSRDESFLLDPLEIRLSYFILANAQEGIFRFNLTEASKILNVSYRHLTRTLKSFCEDGLLEKQGHAFLIVAPDALVRLSESGTR